MGFVKSMVSNSRGAGWNAQQDPNAVNNLQEQYGIIRQAQGDLQNIAAGNGPNPALDQLQQTTDQNIKQNAGMIASQKGINPALAVRLAGQNAGQLNQMAAGQAAVQTANQQLGALGQLGSLAGNTQANIQQGINSANAANAGIAQQNAQGQYGLVKQAGTAAAMLSQGGIVHKYASGGPVSALGQYYAGNNSLNGNAAAFSGGINPAIQDQSLLSSLTGDKPEGLSNSQAGAGAQGIGGQNVAPTGATDLGSLAEVAAHGALIPGRAKVKGDSSKNDTVPAVLSPGEIVIPRSIAQGKDAPKRAAEFVAKVLAKNGLRKK